MSSDIENILQALETELGVMVTIHDLGGIFHDPIGNPLLGAKRQTHKRNPLCFARKRQECVSYCMGKVNAMAGGTQTFLISECWTGLIEVVSPVHSGEIHLATIFAGTWRNPVDLKDVPQCFKKSKSLTDAYLKLPIFNPDKAARLGAIVANAGRGILAGLEGLQHMDADTGGRKEQIYRYVVMNASRKISTKDMARKMCLSSSRAGHLVSEFFGVPFAELVIQERIKRAKNLLCSTDYRVSEIAVKAGFNNEFHFSRMFKKRVGIAPGCFRKRNCPG